MSTATEERTVLHPSLEWGQGQEDGGDVPLTETAKAHLRAVAREMDPALRRVKSIANVVERRIASPSGGPVALTERERMELGDLLELIPEVVQQGIAEPIFARIRGERPHSDGPHLELSEDDLWRLGEDLSRIVYTAVELYSREVSGEEMHHGLSAIEHLASKTWEDLFRRAGIPVTDETLAELEARAGSFGERACELGVGAVNEREGAS